jgi:GNAT superfamily N-acetyltransferase
VLVVDADGRPVSTCVRSVTKNPTRNARPFAAVENVVAHEDYRGQGYGRQVLEAALDRAGARDCEKVMLLTGTDREWKLAFYEECGFDREDKTGFVRYLSD